MSRRQVLLGCGVLGAALFIVTFLVNDAVKPAYEPIRDFVSEASIGQGGWAQIANFLATGALMIAFSFGVRQAVSPWTGRLLLLFGIALAAAGAFVSDPAPTGEATWHGNAHQAATLVVFGSLSAACFTAARWQPTPAWRRYCRVIGVAVPVLFLTAGAVSQTTGLWQRVTIVVGWTWLAVLGLRAMRRERSGPPARRQAVTRAHPAS